MTTIHRRIFLATGIVATSLTFAACGVGPDRSREDAVDTKDVDKSAAHVVAFNNHYPNVSTKCDGFGHRVFVNTDKDMAIVADPTCDGWTPESAIPVVATPARGAK